MAGLPLGAYSGVWGSGFKTPPGGPSACCGLGFAVPHSGSLGLAGGGQHLFMVRACGHNMTLLILVRSFLGSSSLASWELRGALFVLPKEVWTVSTLMSALSYVNVPGATWDRTGDFVLLSERKA